MDVKHMDIKDRNFLLHVLRNPHGWGEDVQREVRQKAATELERCYEFEYSVKYAADELARAVSNGR